MPRAPSHPSRPPPAASRAFPGAQREFAPCFATKGSSHLGGDRDNAAPSGDHLPCLKGGRS